jgi:hypothetical protein
LAGAAALINSALVDVILVLPERFYGHGGLQSFDPLHMSMSIQIQTVNNALVAFGASNVSGRQNLHARWINR